MNFSFVYALIASVISMFFPFTTIDSVLVNGESVLASDKKAYVVVPVNVSELNNDANYSSVSVSDTGTSENLVKYMSDKVGLR